MTTGDDLVVRGLYKAFGDQSILRDLSLTVPAGSVTAVLGASGSGKTTLLRVVAGLERPDRGTIAIGGTALDDGRIHLRPEERRIGYVAQEGNLFPHLSVVQNVGFGLPRRRRRQPEVAALVDAVGLSGLEDRYPHQLSGGQQQRVALARALAVGSQAVLLDEPFNTLDANLRASVRIDVHRIVREAGATAVLVTHDQDEALLLADYVAVLRHGVIAQFATPADLYHRPVDADVASFVGAANLVPGIHDGEGVDTPFGRLPLRNNQAALPPGKVTVLLRPEDIEISSDLDGPGLHGRVSDVEFYGPQMIVRIAVDDRRLDAPIVVRVSGGRELVSAAHVRLTVTSPVCAWPLEAAASSH
jgi:iron(III) transport system ATP-binding protein